jgi:hypothetical protein
MDDKQKETLHVVVHYPAAKEPFKDEAAHRSETVGQLKARVLTAFGLVEGNTPDGNSVQYFLYDQDSKVRLDDPSRTLGSLAGDRKVLQLKLSQQITQGL